VELSRRTGRRLPKAARREQLLATALEIVRERGPDALTLGYLAERAGISKPVTYEHFGTRSGLLIALYRQIDQRHVAVLRAALAQAPPRLADVARVISVSYVNCSTSIGPEWHAISAALKGNSEMEAVQQELLDGYVALCRDALAPYSDLPAEALELRCSGIIGAAEAISREVVRGRTDDATAAANLANLIVSTIGSAATVPPG
jgi:AcrR family transcriptional regulator